MERVLGYITPVRAYVHDGRIYMHVASGRIAEGLAKHYGRVYVCTRVVAAPPTAVTDLPLDAPNIELIAQPYWGSTLGSLRHFFGIACAYMRTCHRSDLLLVRGMCPYIGVLYLFAFLFRRPVCHWIIGNPIALLLATGRNGRLMDALSLMYAWQDRILSRCGRRLTNGAFICNGQELADAFRSPRTVTTVSSTVKESEFFPRTDTCQGPIIRILFAGYIRPEKGLEYLLEAVGRLKTAQVWELHIIGPDQFPQYRKRLDQIIKCKGISERVHWEGYVSYGKPMFDHMRAADLLVLPTLSEGTPHVLVEARSNGLPCISTTVGGVPSTVTNGVDALLVPPKDAVALTRAIEQIVSDGELRRGLIRNGLAAAGKQTVERFVALVLRELEAPVGQSRESDRVGLG